MQQEVLERGQARHFTRLLAIQMMPRHSRIIFDVNTQRYDSETECSTQLPVYRLFPGRCAYLVRILGNHTLDQRINLAAADLHQEHMPESPRSLQAPIAFATCNRNLKGHESGTPLPILWTVGPKRMQGLVHYQILSHGSGLSGKSPHGLIYRLLLMVIAGWFNMPISKPLCRSIADMAMTVVLEVRQGVVT